MKDWLEKNYRFVMLWSMFYEVFVLTVMLVVDFAILYVLFKGR
jgi:hypothetical protein